MRVAHRLLSSGGMKRCHVLSHRSRPRPFARRGAWPLALLGAALMLALATSPARAQPSLAAETPAAPPPLQYVRTTHYGLWVMAVDVAGFAAALGTENPNILVGSYLFAAPSVHLLYGNYKTALGSFGLRAGLVFGGALVGNALAGCDGEDGMCMPLGALLGGVVGAGAALLTDWVLLSEKTTRVYATPPALLRAGSLRANPDLQVGHTGSVLLGLRGSF